MGFDYANSLFSLNISGEYVAFNKQEISRKDNVGLVFFRVWERGEEFLRAAEDGDLSAWQKVKRFFGHKDFSAKTISRLAKETITQLNKKQQETPGRPVVDESVLKNIKSSIELINERVRTCNEIDSENIFSRVFGHKEVEVIDESVWTSLVTNFFKNKVPSGADSAVTILSHEQTTEMPVAQPVAPVVPVAQPVAPVEPIAPEKLERKVSSNPPHGIINPRFLCYCNSTIQLVAQDPELRASIWKDGTNETDKTINDLQEAFKELKKTPSLYDKERFQRIFEICEELKPLSLKPGLEELCESIPQSIEKLKNEREVRKSLLRVLEVLDQKDHTCLSHDKEPLLSFNKAMQKIWPKLGKIGKQRDQREFFLPLLEAIHSPQERRNGFIFQIENTRSGFYNDSEIEIKTKILRQVLIEKDSPEKLRKVYALLTIPTVRPIEPTESEPFVTIHPASDQETQHVKNHFNDVREENVELGDILKNNGKILEAVPELEEFLKSMVDESISREKCKRLPPVLFSQTWMIPGEPKKYLPVYIARFLDEDHKNRNLVVGDPILRIPIKGKDSWACYGIKSITCHSGSDSLRGGHYFHYRPEDNSPVDDSGMPQKWVRISDPTVEHVSWLSIANSVAAEAVFYDYNLI